VLLQILLHLPPNQLRSAGNLVHEQSLNILMLEKMRMIVPWHAAGLDSGLESMSDSFPTRFLGEPAGKIQVAHTGVAHYVKAVVMIHPGMRCDRYTHPKVDLFADHIVAHLLLFTQFIRYVCLYPNPPNVPAQDYIIRRGTRLQCTICIY
jgi:hypothetical protein